MAAPIDELDALAWMSATGNRFALHDGRARPLAEAAARDLARRVGAEVDGLLLVLAPRSGGDCRMVVLNRDGSRAEACGNGLRAVAKLVVEAATVADEHVIETDAGPRRVRVSRRGPEVVAARTEIGRPRVEPLALELGGRRAEAYRVDVGNPHLVVFVEILDDALVAGRGAELEHDARFPERTNVEFVRADPEALCVRVWERGVGETAACGTGAVAAVAASRARGVPPERLLVRMPGGDLRVSFDPAGVAWLEGEVRTLVRSDGPHASRPPVR